MIYFKKNNDVLEKYQVSFDRDEIEKLKQEIIDKCSFITHREYESDYSPRFDKNEIIRNFSYISTGKEKEYFEETREIYLYSYDEYEVPYLVKLINELLSGETKAIDKILNYGSFIHEKTIDEKILYLNQEFNDIDLENITKRINKLKEIEELLKSKELNKNQQSIEIYYNQLLKLIRFKLIDLVSISDIEKVESFFDIKLSNEEDLNEKPYTKSLKRSCE